MDFGWLPGPYVISFGFLAIVLAMSYELASEAVRAADYGRRVEVAERDLARLRENAERVNRVNALGELASVLAHELNQPLAAILSNAQAGRRFLKAGELDAEQQREILDDIVRDDKRAAEVIHGMRAMLRKDALVGERLDLRPVAEEVVTTLGAELAQRGVDCACRFDAELPAVEASRVEVQQVLINLLRNALDSLDNAPRGSRSLAIEIRIQGDGVVTAVTDSGPGIDAELLPRIFEPLMTTKLAGTGMGLAICRRIVEARGGQLGAENASGGARVGLWLPAAVHAGDPGGPG